MDVTKAKQQELENYQELLVSLSLCLSLSLPTSLLLSLSLSNQITFLPFSLYFAHQLHSPL